MSLDEFNAFIASVEADFAAPHLDIEALKARVVTTGRAYAEHLAYVRAQPPGYMSCNPYPRDAYRQAKEALSVAVTGKGLPPTLEERAHAARYAR